MTQTRPAQPRENLDRAIEIPQAAQFEGEHGRRVRAYGVVRGAAFEPGQLRWGF